MNNELIARIDEYQRYRNEHWAYTPATLLFDDCKAEIQRLEALREYVPMTDDEFEQLAEVWMSIPRTDRQDWCNYVEAEVIKRANLEVKP